MLIQSPNIVFQVPGKGILQTSNELLAVNNLVRVPYLKHYKVFKENYAHTKFVICFLSARTRNSPNLWWTDRLVGMQYHKWYKAFKKI